MEDKKRTTKLKQGNLSSSCIEIMDSTTAANTCTTSRFLALPAELRLHIYSHVFSVDPVHNVAAQHDEVVEYANKDCLNPHTWPFPAGKVKIDISNAIATSRNDEDTFGAGSCFTAILRANRQIHDEAVKVLYHQTLFRIVIGPRAVESVDANGKLHIQSSSRVEAGGVQKDIDTPLLDLSLFSKMQNVHLDLNFGSQTNPIWDALTIIRAITATLNSNRKHTTASLRFGLMTAITCARLPEEPWGRFVRQLRSIELGCVPSIEIDKDAESWMRDGRQGFEHLRDVLGGEMRFVEFEEGIGPHDEGLRACVIL